MRGNFVLLARTFTRKLVPRSKPTLPTTSASPLPPAPPPPPATGGNFLDVVKEGFAFGVGSAVARSVVNSVMDGVGGMFGGGGGAPPPPSDTFQHDYTNSNSKQNEEEAEEDDDF